MLPEIFWSRVDRSGECWRWTGARRPDGYAYFFPERGVTLSARRVAWELTHGSLPDDLLLVGTCGDRGCVNPAHYESVNHQEATRRSNSVMGDNARKTECDSGHPLSGGNLYIDPRGFRRCRDCRAKASAAYHARKRSKARA